MGGATLGVSGTVAAHFCVLQDTSVTLQQLFSRHVLRKPLTHTAFAYNVDALLDNESNLIQSQFY
jgi:hypothetical protein